MKKGTKTVILISGILLLILFTAGRATASGNLATLSYLGQSNLPRGMRNNNPGNLKRGSQPWQGEVPWTDNTDGVFSQFEAYIYGVRAMLKLLLNYFADGRDSIQSVIEKYAPSSENNVGAYVGHVAELTGFDPDRSLPAILSTFKKLIPAMARHENGRDCVAPDMVAAAWEML